MAVHQRHFFPNRVPSKTPPSFGRESSQHRNRSLKLWTAIGLLAGLVSASAEVAMPKIIIAHRGASGYLPEHTLPAKALAHAMGADYLEQDHWPGQATRPHLKPPTIRRSKS